MIPSPGTTNSRTRATPAQSPNPTLGSPVHHRSSRCFQSGSGNAMHPPGIARGHSLARLKGERECRYLPPHAPRLSPLPNNPPPHTTTNGDPLLRSFAMWPEKYPAPAEETGGEVITPFPAARKNGNNRLRGLAKLALCPPYKSRLRCPLPLSCCIHRGTSSPRRRATRPCRQSLRRRTRPRRAACGAGAHAALSGNAHAQAVDKANGILTLHMRGGGGNIPVWIPPVWDFCSGFPGEGRGRRGVEQG
eukprot:gene22092-biopygen7171